MLTCLFLVLVLMESTLIKPILHMIFYFWLIEALHPSLPSSKVWVQFHFLWLICKPLFQTFLFLHYQINQFIIVIVFLFLVWAAFLCSFLNVFIYHLKKFSFPSFVIWLRLKVFKLILILEFQISVCIWSQVFRIIFLISSNLKFQYCLI